MEMTLNEEIEYLQSGDWYDKTRLVLSNDEYLKLGWAIGDILETLELLKSLAPEPETNADRIRRMSDEELANTMYRNPTFTVCDAVCKGDCAAIDTLNDTKEDACKRTILEWLQQPAEEDT